MADKFLDSEVAAREAEAEALFDVVAVRLDDSRVRMIASSKTLANAEAIVTMAVVRRGCEIEFFAEVPTRMYRDGDLWTGSR